MHCNWWWKHSQYQVILSGAHHSIEEHHSPLSDFKYIANFKGKGLSIHCLLWRVKTRYSEGIFTMFTKGTQENETVKNMQKNCRTRVCPLPCCVTDTKQLMIFFTWKKCIRHVINIDSVSYSLHFHIYYYTVVGENCQGFFCLRPLNTLPLG